MLWGFPWTVPWGSHEDFIQTQKSVDLIHGVSVRFTPFTGYSQNYRLAVDSDNGGPPLYCTAGVPYELRGKYVYADGRHFYSICPMGDWTDATIDVTGQMSEFVATRADRLWIQTTVGLDFATAGDSGQLSSWALTGFQRFQNCKPVAFNRTWGSLDLTIADVAGTRTVTLSLNGLTVATGSRVGDGSITMTASNSSGISGTVVIAYTGDISSGANLYISWPPSTKVYYRTTIYGAPPSGTAQGTIYDNGRANNLFLRSDRLVAGTYYVIPHQVDEDGNESTGLFGGGYTSTIVAPPEPPTNLAYLSGGYAATVISWTASTTSAATYNIYDSGEALNIDMSAATGTHIAGTGTLTQTLAAVSAGFTGTRYIIVRAVKAGVEEGNAVILAIEYTSGTRVNYRPNQPAPTENVTRSGRTLTVPFTINTTGQLVAPATVEIFLFAAGASPSYGSPDATLTLAGNSTTVGNMIQASISVTAGVNVVRNFAIRSKSAALVQSNNTDTYGPVRLTTATPPDGTATVRAGT